MKRFSHKLAQLNIVRETFEGDKEVVFAVDWEYAMDFFDMTDDELLYFLENEYTSEDSEQLYYQALLDSEIQYERTVQYDGTNLLY